MEKDDIIKITLALYRVTEKFPEKEPLKFSIREEANEILAEFIMGGGKSRSPGDILKKIEVLQDYFKIAEKQNWVNSKNFFVLGKKYGEITKEARGLMLLERSQKEGIQNEETLTGEGQDYERRKKIIEILKKKKKAQTGEFENFFPDTSKRTLRRDLQYLLDKGLVKRVGDGNRTFYKIS